MLSSLFIPKYLKIFHQLIMYVFYGKLGIQGSYFLLYMWQVARTKLSNSRAPVEQNATPLIHVNF